MADAWIGYDLPAPPRAIREQRWRPDRPERWCPRCGSTVGVGERTPSGCAACRDGSAVADAVVRLGAYRPPLRDWILAIKYAGWTAMAERLGGYLGRALDRSGHAAAPLLVVPMPMPPLRRIARGSDHAATIAAGVARRLDAPVLPLLKRRDGPSQAALGGAERRRRPGRDIRCASGRAAGRLRIPGRTIVIIDDVLTTGSTALAARRQLDAFRPGGVVIGVLAVADADRVLVPNATE